MNIYDDLELSQVIACNYPNQKFHKTAMIREVLSMERAAAQRSVE